MVLPNITITDFNVKDIGYSTIHNLRNMIFFPSAKLTDHNIKLQTTIYDVILQQM